MSVNIYKKETDTLQKVAGNAEPINIWTGTSAEYEAEKDTIPDGSYVNITDDTDTYELNFPDGTGFYPDIKDGVRGYNTSESRGADTFFPFKSGGYNLKNLVPVLTGNTSWPKGVASASSVYSNNNDFGAWKAFNENLTGSYHWWASNVSGTNQWIQFKFNTPQIVRIIQFEGATPYLTSPINYQIQGSNDGLTWVTLYSETGNSSNEKIIVLEDDKVNSYSYYRLYGSSWNTASGWCGLSMLRFIGDCITEDIGGNDVIIN